MMAERFAGACHGHSDGQDTRSEHGTPARLVRVGSILVIVAGAVAALLPSAPVQAEARAIVLTAPLTPLAAVSALRTPPHKRRTTTFPARRGPGDCVLVVPAQPLTASGLATPYQLSASRPGATGCDETNPQQAAFVEGAVLDPATGALSIYDPLVINRGTRPAVAPAVPKLPTGAIVALWFGFNGQVIRLQGAQTTTLRTANCVNGLPGSPFGQVAYCNATRFFHTATQLIQSGKLVPPGLGTGKDGQTCPTVRDFSVVDQDQSDNVTTSYLVTSDGRLAQNTAANATTLADAGVTTNGSDNRLLAVALDGALGCTPWMAPDLADGGALTTAQPLDELQAAQLQPAPVALVPSRDPMVLVNNVPSLPKQNLYRAGVDQTPETSAQQAQSDLRAYCRNLLQVAPARLRLEESLTSAWPSPDPAVATSLYTFLAQRFDHTFGAQGLGCDALLHQRSPITTHANAQGITTGAAIAG